MKWPFFWDLNRLLGSLPLNDTTLVDESLASNHATPAVVEVGFVVSLRKVSAFLNNKSFQCTSGSQWQMHEIILKIAHRAEFTELIEVLLCFGCFFDKPLQSDETLHACDGAVR